MNRRRFAFVPPALIAAALSMTAVGVAQAWSLTIGGSERVEGNGTPASEVRNVGGFDAVALSGNFMVQVRGAGADKVEVKADSNLLPYLETRVVENSKGRTLEISPKRGYQLNSRQTPVISIDARTLRAVSVAGSGDVRVEAIKSNSLQASIAGSGDIRLADVDADELSLRVAGSGDILAQGRARLINIAVAGSGDVKARDVTAEEGKVTIAGSGDVAVNAQRLLSVKISGSGDVAYGGNPELGTSIVGSGRLRKLTN